MTPDRQAFEARIDDDREYCEFLFHWATVRLLAHKWAYYVCSDQFVDDAAYDGEERSWHMMGQALGHLTEDETSPCVDWDSSHPLADEALAYAKTLTFKGA